MTVRAAAAPILNLTADLGWRAILLGLLCYPKLAQIVVLLPSRRVSRNFARPEGYNQMRLKLVLISSLLAAITGAGSAIAIIVSVFSSLHAIATPGLLVVSTYLLPILTTLLASIFVYRHTARRRKLQAILTATIAAILTILFFVVASIVLARREPVQPQPKPPQNVSRS